MNIENAFYICKLLSQSRKHFIIHVAQRLNLSREVSSNSKGF